MSLIVTTQTTQRINYTVPDHNLEDALFEVLMTNLRNNLFEAGMSPLLDDPKNLKDAESQIRNKVQSMVTSWCNAGINDDELDVSIAITSFESKGSF